MTDVSLIAPGIRHEPLKSHSGLELDWWWDVLEVNNDILAEKMHWVHPFSNYAGIETGGWNLVQLAPGRPGKLSVNKSEEVEIHAKWGGLLSWEVILWDDVVTTGQSMIEAEGALSKHGIEVVQRVCVLDRREEFNDQIKANCPCGGFSLCNGCRGLHLEVTSLFTTSDLVAAGLVSVEGEVE